MKFEPSLQLKTRTTLGNQEFFATKRKSVPNQPTEAEQDRERVYCPYCDVKSHPRWTYRHLDKHRVQNE